MISNFATTALATLATLTTVSEAIRIGADEESVYTDYSTFKNSWTRAGLPSDLAWEPYTVVSEGWYLTVFRIYSTDPSIPTDKNPLLIQPGNGGMPMFSLKSWQMDLPSRGIEVWLSNQRGYVYSDKNERDGEWSLKERWDFTFADKGYYDIPAMVEKIQEVTGKPKVSVMGTS